MRIIEGAGFDAYWKNFSHPQEDETVLSLVREIIAAVRTEGDAAVRRYAAKFDKSSPPIPEVPAGFAAAAWDSLKAGEGELAWALELAAEHIRRFALEQKMQFGDFEYPMGQGLVTGQRVIPVERAAVYAPGGRFPLVSTVLMGLIPALSAGVEEAILASPPGPDGLPDRRILAAAALTGRICGKVPRIFALGGAQAIAALALGTETVPRVDIIAGPGNKYVAAAKRLLYGQVGIDFVAGPTDVLIIAEPADPARSAELVAADMLAQAEHDPDARARALVPRIGEGGPGFAEEIRKALERRLRDLPTRETARASLEAGGLIVIYRDQAEAARIANAIAPEHLELQTRNPESWLPLLKNYGSLFIGPLAAEALGDYSAGINHTLPTSGSARFTGGLSVRHFLKTLTTLRCGPGEAFDAARRAAVLIAGAEGLTAHGESAGLRGPGFGAYLK
ncbi:MAG: histidinol dehydrogenase [Treponema sp.]|jgi:histidinol dehydrogenase|nr:histidinol dehydrogenase [Treponema sp.]